MDQEHRDESDLNRNNQRIADERVRVVIERLGSEEHHQVARDVQDQYRNSRIPVTPMISFVVISEPRKLRRVVMS